MHVITTPQGRRFEAQADEYLLDAALRQGIVLDYSCRTGRCGSCKGRLLTGKTAAVNDEIGLTANERSDGWVLTCVRKACSNIDLDIEDLGDVSLPESRTLPCRIHALEKFSQDVLRVVLRLPPNRVFDYLPGQYVDIIGPGGLRRSYSIANAPHDDERIELHVREVPGGTMSSYWFQAAKVSDLLRLRGPSGTFFLRDYLGKDLVFLATGTGISPVKAILEGLQRVPPSQQPRSISIHWGGRRAEDMYWTPPTDRRMRFVQVLSRPEPDWPGARGYVQDVFLQDAPDLANSLVYACGSDAMIRSAEARLRAAGLPNRAFRSDAFVCSAPT